MTTASTPPAGSHDHSRWPVVAAFAALAAATQLIWLNYAPVTTAAAAHFGVPESAIGWLANVNPLLYVFLAIPAGLLLDRWFKAGIAAGALLTAAGAALRLVEWCKQKMASYKYPRLVEFRDTLPMTATGKILKRELRTQPHSPVSRAQ